MRTIREADIANKIVLLRTDYNVPLEDGRITNDLRIRASLPTIEFLRENRAKKIFIISHLGRPKGVEDKLSLALVAKRLGELITGVTFVPALYGEEVRAVAEQPGKGEVVVLENLRFEAGEEGNSEDFMRKIVESTGAEIFVQDGFAVVHRAHASTVAVTKLLPSYAGMLVEKEVNNLLRAISVPKRPLLLIIGGSKVDDKALLIDRFRTMADTVVVGGKIAADGYPAGDKIYVAEDFDEDAEGNKMDVGPFSVAKITELIAGAGTIVWNGVLGKVEDPAYSTASTIVAEAMGEKDDAETIICGGDTAGFVENLMLEHPNLNYSLVSTGGGAALEFLLGKKLPGLESLEW